jgi:hypothetical protein
MDRHSVRDRAAEQFDGERIVDSIITAVNKARRDWQGGLSRRKRGDSEANSNCS